MDKHALAILSTAAPVAEVEKAAALFPGGFWQLIKLALDVMNILGTSWPSALAIIQDVAALLNDPAGFNWDNAVALLGVDAPKVYAILVLIAAALGITLPPIPVLAKP